MGAVAHAARQSAEAQTRGLIRADAMTPPPYPTKATLAALLDCSESTVDEWVRRGIIPRPIKLPTGGVRWRWEDVDLALKGYAAGTGGEDPISRGIRNAAQVP
jgi:predicted DNA-binding transcriptional regulator AlpA